MEDIYYVALTKEEIEQILALAQDSLKTNGMIASLNASLSKNSAAKQYTVNLMNSLNKLTATLTSALEKANSMSGNQLPL